ncbi:MAG: protein-glutamate O-methyltransferase CheR [Planctomycetales bacterium]|nr:protein-glutamate O-methyltransferase CheR [Planctomycetales bacterium]
MSLATADFTFLCDLVARHSGNIIAARHAGMLEQRLVGVAGSVGARDLPSLVKRLRDSGDLALSDQVAEAVTVNETRFFRDEHLFEALRSYIIPELIRKNAKRKEIRIWSAACSSGQEPYSVAMVLREYFPQLSDWRINIVATDLSLQMLQRVQAGTYSQLEVSRGVSPKNLVRFFDRSGAGWQIKQELRDMIEVQRVNLTRPWPYMGQFDIALVRNVLIYFDRQTKNDILKRVRGALRPEGYLFIGAAETLIGLSVPYQRREIDATIIYRPTNC